MQTIAVCFSCAFRLEGQYREVHELEQAILEAGREGCRQLDQQACRTDQQQWLVHRRHCYQAVRWRRQKMIPPFGKVEVPIRVARKQGSQRGGYLSASKMLWKGKATKMLSPWVEKLAVEAVPQQLAPTAAGWWEPVCVAIATGTTAAASSTLSC